MAYIYLALAILAEVVATSAVKASDGFTRLVPSLIVIVGYGLTLFFFSLTVKDIPVGVAYAFWSGLGVVLITITAALIYKQVPDFAAIVGMMLIIAGVATIQLFSKSVHSL